MLLLLKYKQFCLHNIVYICKMENKLSIIKGIHPGFILERELKIRHIRKGRFALDLEEYPQTIVSITKGKRRMNLALALKIEKALGFEEGTFMILQLYYDIEKQKQLRQTKTPDLSKLRAVLFWDTQIEKIDWEKHQNAVIRRVFERGNEGEKNEMIRFYGVDKVNEVLNANIR